MEKKIGIGFPFSNVSSKGDYLYMTETTADEIKSNLMHLLLTPKGSRFMNYEFGTNLHDYIFDPNDQITHDDLVGDLKNTVSKYIPGLTLKTVDITTSDSEEYAARLTVEYNYTNNIFQNDDKIIIEI